ncbi:hypothetical protein SAMN04488693_10655 [Arthrobacter subterraneus]|uniref:DUF4352 domain-containing protein n=1 Tax=Arthrobacter subterraneus TaxID=335973 RepID=A0A1G8HXC1_9MICC|nr:hypothetical protein [Arthrobacter subterraneus]SDI11212.1 hypothetical protein SAMN04488693_10655 [Arthrobacter subterraneus]
MAIEEIALAEQDAADLMPGEAADRPNGLTRRVFGILIGSGALATAAGWGVLSAAGGTEEVPTSFGSVRISAAERQARMAGVLSAGGHTAGSHAVTGTAQPFNHTWGEHVAVKLEVRNTSERNVLFAPGQLRLLVANTTTVTNRAADVAKILLTPGSHRSLWISFLVPSGASGLSARFTDPWGGPAPLVLALPRISLRPGSLEENHG